MNEQAFSLKKAVITFHGSQEKSFTKEDFSDMVTEKL